MRIALISEHASPLALIGGTDAGGQNVAVGELALALAAIGYEVDIFTRWQDRQLPQVVHWRDDVRVVHIQAGPQKFVPKEDMLPHMEEFTAGALDFMQMQDRPYRLVHAHFWMSALVAADIKRRLGVPFVVTFHALGRVRQLHQGDDDQSPPQRYEAELRAVREADKIIALCQQDRDDLMEHYGALAHKIAVIPNGFNPDDFYPVGQQMARLLLGLDNDPEEQIILSVGRLVPRKGNETLIRALGLLRSRYKMSPRLLVVGGPSNDADPDLTPEIGRLQEVSRQAGVRDLVTFTGGRATNVLRYYYSAADVFVTVPWYEPFGMTPLEAMACGTPVIGSAVGGIKSTVQHGVNGLLVPPKSPSTLAFAIYSVLKNPVRLNRFSANALARVNPEYTWKNVAFATADIYEEIVPILNLTRKTGRGRS